LRAGQRSVESAFAVSCRDLDALSRRVFFLLGAAPGADFSVAAVAALDGTSQEGAERSLEDLVDANLVETPEPGRYRLHDLLRLYAGEHVGAEVAESDRNAALRRLHSWRLHSVKAAVRTARLLGNGWVRLPTVEPGVAPKSFADLGEARAWLDVERVNLLAAIRSGPGGSGFSWHLSDALADYLGVCADPGTQDEAAEIGLRAAEADDDRDGQAVMHLRLSTAAYNRADYRADAEHAERALDLLGPDGNPRPRARALSRLAVAASGRGALPQAIDYIRQAVVMERELDSGRLPVVLNISGSLASESGDFRQAAEFYSEALECLRRSGSPNAYVVLNNLGYTRLRLGDPEAARDLLSESEEVCLHVGAVRAQAETCGNLALLHQLCGETDRAGDAAWKAVNLARDVGARDVEMHMLCTLAAVLSERRPEQAERVARQALKLSDAVSSATAKVKALTALAEASTGLGRTGPAVDCARRAIAAARERGYRMLEGHALLALGEARLVEGDAAPAVSAGEKALVCHRSTENRPGEARTRQLLTAAYEARGDAAAAREHSEAAAKLFAQMGVPPMDPRTRMAEARPT
ncbi:MAG: tetratricopeptide repeat protein, partial [Stackebrandtia sp.]